MKIPRLEEDGKVLLIRPPFARGRPALSRLPADFVHPGYAARAFPRIKKTPSCRAGHGRLKSKNGRSARGARFAKCSWYVALDFYSA